MTDSRQAIISHSTADGREHLHYGLGAWNAGIIPPIVSDVLRSSGEPLGIGIRDFFEPRFSCDFSDVRIHSDPRADASARSLNAKAYTARHHVVFAAGEYAPANPGGRRLLAHELTHVVQQRRAGGCSTSWLNDRGGRLEAEADQSAERVCAGLGVQPISSAATPSIQRQSGTESPAEGGAAELLRYIRSADREGLRDLEGQLGEWLLAHPQEAEAARPIELFIRVRDGYVSLVIGVIEDDLRRSRVVLSRDVRNWLALARQRRQELSLTPGSRPPLPIPLTVRPQVELLFPPSPLSEGRPDTPQESLAAQVSGLEERRRALLADVRRLLRFASVAHLEALQRLQRTLERFWYLQTLQNDVRDPAHLRRSESAIEHDIEVQDFRLSEISNELAALDPHLRMTTPLVQAAERTAEAAVAVAPLAAGLAAGAIPNPLTGAIVAAGVAGFMRYLEEAESVHLGGQARVRWRAVVREVVTSGLTDLVTLGLNRVVGRAALYQLRHSALRRIMRRLDRLGVPVAMVGPAAALGISITTSQISNFLSMRAEGLSDDEIQARIAAQLEPENAARTLVTIAAGTMIGARAHFRDSSRPRAVRRVPARQGAPAEANTPRTSSARSEPTASIAAEVVADRPRDTSRPTARSPSPLVASAASEATGQVESDPSRPHLSQPGDATRQSAGTAPDLSRSRTRSRAGQTPTSGNRAARRAGMRQQASLTGIGWRRRLTATGDVASPSQHGTAPIVPTHETQPVTDAAPRAIDRRPRPIRRNVAAGRQAVIRWGDDYAVRVNVEALSRRVPRVVHANNLQTGDLDRMGELYVVIHGVYESRPQPGERGMTSAAFGGVGDSIPRAELVSPSQVAQRLVAAGFRGGRIRLVMCLGGSGGVRSFSRSLSAEMQLLGFPTEVFGATGRVQTSGTPRPTGVLRAPHRPRDQRNPLMGRSGEPDLGTPLVEQGYGSELHHYAGSGWRRDLVTENIPSTQPSNRSEQVGIGRRVDSEPGRSADADAVPGDTHASHTGTPAASPTLGSDLVSSSAVGRIDPQMLPPYRAFTPFGYAQRLAHVFRQWCVETNRSSRSTQRQDPNRLVVESLRNRAQQMDLPEEYREALRDMADRLDPNGLLQSERYAAEIGTAIRRREGVTPTDYASTLTQLIRSRLRAEAQEAGTRLSSEELEVRTTQALREEAERLMQDEERLRVRSRLQEEAHEVETTLSQEELEVRTTQALMPYRTALQDVSRFPRRRGLHYPVRTGTQLLPDEYAANEREIIRQALMAEDHRSGARSGENTLDHRLSARLTERANELENQGTISERFVEAIRREARRLTRDDHGMQGPPPGSSR